MQTASHRPTDLHDTDSASESISHERRIGNAVMQAMQDTPVIVLNGARQVGKSTLMKSLVQTMARNVRYYTFDDPSTRAAAQRDPLGFIRAQTGPIFIDEVQHVPEIFQVIKLVVDEQRIPGQFLLSGSVNVLMLPRLADSLAGRVEIITLWPLAQAELSCTPHNLIDDAFAPLGGDRDRLTHLQALPHDRADMLQTLLTGGYPEVQRRRSAARRGAWFTAYCNTVLLRDIRDLAQIEGLAHIPQLFAHLAHKACGVLNTADLGRSLGIPQTTLKRYLTLLQTVYFIHLLPAWSHRESHRAQKAPKLFFNDSGLLAHSLGIKAAQFDPVTGLPGAVLETWVFNELCKQQGWSDTAIQLMHYRTSTGVEVDFILQDAQGRVVGIEVKASSQVSSKDLKGLQHLRELLGSQFHRGIVLYMGAQTVSFDAQLQAVPISALWAQA